MIFNKDNNIAIITQEKSTLSELVKKLEVMYPKFKNDDVIINLLASNKVELASLEHLLTLSNKHRKAKHSFVIVTNQVDVDDLLEDLIVVPTEQEAYDIIEMEAMERDLGF